MIRTYSNASLQLSAQEKLDAKRKAERARLLSLPCATCVWGHIESDRIFCPIVGGCWRDFKYPYQQRKKEKKEGAEDAG